MQHYRVIIRVSLNKDTGSKVRNYIEGYLKRKYDLDNTKTGTWESADMSLNEAALAVRELMVTIADPHGNVDSADPDIALDHVWIYIDKLDNA